MTGREKFDLFLEEGKRQVQTNALVIGLVVEQKLLTVLLKRHFRESAQALPVVMMIADIWLGQVTGSGGVMQRLVGITNTN